MRTVYREHLDNFAHDLIIMCDKVEEMLRLATRALLEPDLQAAEDTLSTKDELVEIKERCEERAVSLLALQNPMAKDLRQVVSSIYIVEDLYRMGQLARHIANMARSRYPEHTFDVGYAGFYEEMSRLNLEMLQRTRELLINPDADTALDMVKADDAVDDIHQHIKAVLTLRPWNGTTRDAVDMGILSRFFERFADHSVNVAERIVFLTTGLQPLQYLAKKDEEARAQEMELRFADLERQFHR